MGRRKAFNALRRLPDKGAYLCVLERTDMIKNILVLITPMRNNSFTDTHEIYLLSALIFWIRTILVREIKALSCF